MGRGRGGGRVTAKYKVEDGTEILTDKFVVTTLDNRLDSLANQYYGDVSLWWVIAKANGIKGKTVLKAGQIIRIPGEIPKILEEFDDLNGR